MEIDSAECVNAIVVSKPVTSNLLASEALSSAHFPYKQSNNFVLASLCNTLPEMLETANNKAVDANASQRNSVVLLAMTDQDTAAFVYPKNTFVTTSLNSCDALVTSGLSLPDPENIISTLRWQMEGATNAQSPGSGVNQLSSYVFNKGTTRITYQGTTRNNNPIYCTFTLTVRDNQAPRLVFSPGNITVSNSTGKCYARVNWTEPIVADNCVATENLIIKSNYKPGDEFPVGETKVEYRISDGLNETIHSFLVTVVDREAPELTAPETIVVVCGEEVEDAFTSWKQFEQAGGKVSDNCAVDFESFRYVRQIASAIRCPYTITRTYSIADVGGNVTEVKHLIKVLGESMVSETKEKAEESQLLLKAGAVNQAEIAFLKTDVTCKGGNDGTVKLTVSGTSGALSYVWLTSNGNGIVQGRKDQTTLSDGEYTVRIFEDGDLLLEFDFSILVSDNEAPHITAPENITLDCGQTIPAAYSIWSEFANAGGAVWDNCRIYYSSFRLASESKSNPDCPYTLTRTYEITDINGNRGYAEHLITVEAGEVVLKSGAGTAGTITARATGDWNLASTWDCNCVPDFEDDVIIPSGFTVTVDAAAECNNITIETGGTLDHSGATTLQVYGNWTNNGIYSSGSGTIEFTGSADAVIGGSSTTTFSNFILNKGSDVTTDLTVKTDITITDLTFENGVLDIESGTTDIADIVNSNNTIPSTAGIRVSGGTLTTGYYSIINEGLIEVTSGSATFGTGSGNSVHIQTDGAFIVTGGTVDIAGRLENTAGGTLSGYPSGINISGGIITLATAGNNESGTGSLDVTTNGAFNFTGGTIIFENPSTAGAALDLGLIDGTGNGTKIITNGIFQFGNNYTPNGSIFHIDSEIKIPHIDTYLGSALFLDIPMNGTFTVECIDQATEPTPPEVLDNCGYEISPTGPVIGGSFNGCSGTRSYTYTYEDCDGSTHEWVYVYTIDDVTAPTVQPLAAVNVECIEDVPVNDISIVSATDNCVAPLTVTFEGDVSDGRTCPETITRTYRVADACGNFTEVEQTITVNDVTAPTVQPLAAVNVECVEDVPVNDISIVLATDNCVAPLTVTFEGDVSDGRTCPETITRTYRVSDACGNFTEVEQTITVNDVTAPTVQPLAAVNVECVEDVPVNDISIVLATDNCVAPLTVTFEGDVSDGRTCPETITRTYRVADACGNFTEVEQTITVNDVTAPAVQPLAAVNVECVEDVPVNDISIVLATDNCVAPLTVTFEGDVSDGRTCPETITRTYRVSDACGNFTEVEQTITVNDVTAPAVQPLAAVNVECVEDVPVNDISIVLATDNCVAPLTVTFEGDVSDGRTCPETITRTYRVSDACGNFTEVEQTITVNDVTAPTVQPLAAVNVECVEDVPVNDISIVLATDNCVAPLTVTFEGDVSDGRTCPETITRTYRVSDACGNFTEVEQTITVNDVTAPTVQPLAAVNVECVEDVPVNDISIVLATDNCVAPLTVTFEGDVSDGRTCPETITRTYRVADACGNFTEVEQTITVNDVTAPTVQPLAAVSVECVEDVPVNDISIVLATDNCVAPLTVTFEGDVSDGRTCPETITRTYRVADACGNFTEVEQTITVNDVTAPAVQPLAAVNVECVEDVPVNDISIVLATDNCVAPLTVTFEGDVSDGRTCPETITRTYRVADACGNFTEVEQTITVNDVTAPAVQPLAAVNVECVEDVPVNDISIVLATDNCVAPLTVTFEGDVSDGRTCPETITRTYRVADACGNFTEVEQTITVNDVTAPAVQPLAAVNVECVEDVPVNDISIVLATDNCVAPLTVTFEGDVSDGRTCPETITRTYRVADACGNFTEVEQTITVNDVTAPAVQPLAAVNVECVEDVPVNDISIVLATDNCVAPLTVTFEGDVSDGRTCPETITRTYRVSDACGNFTEVEQTITVNDVTAPAVQPLAAVNVECVEDVPVNDISIVLATDNCVAPLTVTFEGDVSDGRTCPETITRTYRVSDACGNQTLVTQTITIDDTTAPTASNPPPINVECTADVPAPDITVVTDEADNCTANPVVAHVSDVSNGGFNPEVITRTYSITDDCGNSINVAQTITIDDVTPPDVQCKPLVVQLDAAGNATVNPNQIDNGSNDNCTAIGDLVFALDITDFDCDDLGDNIVTLTVTDKAGNSESCTATVTVEDNINPTANCREITIQLNSSGTAVIAASDIDYGSSDNCSIKSVTIDKTIFSCEDVGDNTVTLTVTDASGNSSTCEGTVTVEDKTKPIAICKNFTVQLDETGNASITAADIDKGSYDACGIASRDLDRYDFTCEDLGTNAVTLTVTDNNGNQSSCPAVVTVIDNLPPTASAGGNATICIDETHTVSGANANNGTIEWTHDGNGTLTNSNSLSPSYTSVLADAGNTVTLTLTVTGNNACGNNTATASYLVDVNPVATVNPIAAMEYCEGETTPAVALSSNLGAAVTFNITGGQDIGLFNKNNVTEIPSFTANAGTRIVTITPVYNGCPGEPLNVEITVNPTPSVSASPLFQTICSGEETAILLGSNLAGSTFNWTATVDPAGSVSGVADGVNESTNTITQTLVNNTFSEATVTYRIYAENGDCPGAAMDIVVKVKPGLTAGITGDATVCQEDPEPNIIFTVNGGTAPYIFTYTINDGANQDVELNAGNTIDVPVPTDTDGDFTYKLVSVYEASGCTHLFNETATVTVSPKPYLSSTLTPTGVCSNNAFAYTPASATTGTTFSWSRAAIAGIDNPAETGTDAIDEFLINTTNAPIPVVYTYTLEAAGCTNTQDVVVMVTPTPSLTSTLNPDGVCSESLFSYTPTSDVSETTFPWTRAAVTGISNPAAAGTGDINEVLINTTDNPVAVTYEYTLTSNDCINQATYSVVVVVTPAPEVTASADVSCVCPGGTFNLTSFSDISGGTPLPGTLLAEDFNGSASGWTTTNTSTGGDPSDAAWTLRPNNYNFSISWWNDVTFRSNDYSQFYLSNSREQGTSGWWGDYYTRTTLESPVFSTVGYSSLELDFYHYYEDNGGDYANIEVSTDGANWTQVRQFNSDRGSSTNFRHETIDLTAYISQPTLYIRFRYEATEDYYWAIDNITLTGESTGGAVDVSWESFNEDFSSSFGEFSILANPTNVTIHEPTQFVVTYVDPDTNCPGRDTVFVDICETPDPVIAPDYCAYEGRVLLTAYGGADGASYSWVDSNGDVVGTDQELIVDIVDVYTLTITNPNGCSATTQLTVSNELIINGDFEAGNTGFSSDYSFVEPYLNNPPDDAPRDGTPWSSLWPEGLYGVGTNARHYHTNFWGRQDHTSGSGYFMIVNGNVNAGTPIWEQTVNVQPNTNYYFSAWAMSLNSAGNDAVLQFEVNEVLVGSLARLNRGTGNNSNNGWVRFYSEPNWNSGNVSGPITVRIRNVEPAAGGNDFALDDISFGTFDPFPLEIDVAFDDVCEGDTLFLYSNSQYGKEPITYSWTGPDGWTSNEPNPFIPNFSSANAGKYKLEALDGYGCEILPDSTDVPFNAAPVANAGPDDFVCTANPVVNLNGTIGGSATSGYWTGGGGTFDDATKPDAIYTLSQAEIDAGIAELILSTDDPAGVCEAYRDTLYITIHNSLEITTSSTTPDCHGRENGLATVTVSVPTVGPYTYLWSDGQTTPTARNLSAGTYTVTVTDANGCTASEEVIVDEPDLFVISATSPIITAPSCYGANDGSATMEVTGGTAPYTFIWDAATGDQRTATASNLAAGTYTVLVTDANGCSAATFTATIPNPPPPTLNCPEDLEGLVDPASCTVTFGDIEEPMMDGYCTTTLTYELSGATTGSGTGSVNGQVDFNVGLTTVKYKIEDTAGNKDSCTFTVLAKHLDLDPTIYSCPPATVHAGAPDSYLCYKTVALDAVELDDDCNEIESIWHDSPYSSDPSDASGDYPVGTTNFSWYIRDVSGNIKTCDVTVIVDDLGPQITCPADVSEEIAANECSKTGVTINPPEYRDNCPNAELSYVLSGATTGSGMGVVPSYQVFNIGVTTVTYTVTDVNNNTAECSFTVTIERLSIPPAVIICPDSPDPVTAVAGTCFAPVTVAAPVINDPCATTNYTIINDFNHTDNASDSYPVGTTTVNWTITDNSGKTYTCVQEVIVEDLPPTIDCPDNYTFLADENVDYKDNVTLDYPTYADNCPNPIVEWTRVEPNGTITQSSSAGINFIPNPGRYYIGVTTITYKITDLSGLTDDCSFTVTVTGPPDITCPPVYETTTDPGVCTATRSSDDYGLPTLNEGVQPITWIWTIYNPDGTVGATNSATPFVGSAANPGPPAIPDYAFKRGTSTITWHVENISGFDECSYEVIVTDKEPPTLDADPYENCVDPLHWAVYNPSNPNPVFNHTNANLEKFPVDYRTLYAEDTSLDLTSLKDNCCDSTEMTIHWRIEFSDTPDPQDGTWVSHDAISGTGQPSTYVHPTTGVPTDIYLWGDGVTFQPVVHRIYYWVIDCNGNQSETVEKTITILPRPQIIKMNY